MVGGAVFDFVGVGVGLYFLVKSATFFGEDYNGWDDNLMLFIGYELCVEHDAR
jgi:hypothetical protein